VHACHGWLTRSVASWQGKKNALDELTEEDVKVLEEIDEEYARRGAFKRIFPQNNEQMHKWMQLFEVKRFLNILQYHWVTRSSAHPARTYFEQQRASAMLSTPIRKPLAARLAKARSSPKSTPPPLQPQQRQGAGSEKKGSGSARTASASPTARDGHKWDGGEGLQAGRAMAQTDSHGGVSSKGSSRGAGAAAAAAAAAAHSGEERRCVFSLRSTNGISSHLILRAPSLTCGAPHATLPGFDFDLAVCVRQRPRRHCPRPPATCATQPGAEARPSVGRASYMGTIRSSCRDRCLKGDFRTIMQLSRWGE
jgi:hypothetical protein